MHAGNTNADLGLGNLLHGGVRRTVSTNTGYPKNGWFNAIERYKWLKKLDDLGYPCELRNHRMDMVIWSAAPGPWTWSFY